jgi:hypothetical protein
MPGSVPAVQGNEVIGGDEVSGRGAQRPAASQPLT